jgi:hypothetical protein
VGIIGILAYPKIAKNLLLTAYHEQKTFNGFLDTLGCNNILEKYYFILIYEEKMQQLI